MAELIHMLYREAQTSTTGQEHHPIEAYQKHDQAEGCAKVPKQPPVSPVEAVQLLVKYH